MSKGGAGKVYFVLYLAVILELLIIIVERDEAEEHLMKKQQESMRIVESILTQLQSGAGTEGINTRPQDAIVLSDELPEEQRKFFKKFRTYYIEVGVTDVASALNMDGMDATQKKEKAETLKKLANVQELQYEIYYHPSTDPEVPQSPASSEYKKVQTSPQAKMTLANPPNSSSTETWTLEATRKLDLDIKAMSDFKEPVYVESSVKAGNINEFSPPDSANANRIFGYSKDKTEKLMQSGNGKLTKRAFVCNFQPPTKAGWYKLRFSSQTNRILGISADQKFNALKDDQKVNIGTVQLKVKDLKSVQRQLSDQLSGTGIPSSEAFANGSLDLEKFNDQLEVAKKKVSDNGGDKVAQNTSRIDLYGYIAKLLSPGRYTSFDQNKGNIEIDIFVQKPEIKEGTPDVSWYAEEAYTFDKAPRLVLKLNTNYYNKKGKSDPIVTYNNSRLVVKRDTKSVQTADRGDWIVEFPIKDNDPGVDSIQYRLIANFGEKDKKGASATDEIRVTVFSTGLAKIKAEKSLDEEGQDENSSISENSSSNRKELEENFSKLLERKIYKGSKLDFRADPNCFNLIPANQFRIELTGTNKDADGIAKPIIGYSISDKQAYEIPMSSDEVTVKIYWVDPYDESVKVNIYPIESQGPASFKPSIRPPVIENITITEIDDLGKPTITISADIYSEIGSKKELAQIENVKFELIPVISTNTPNTKNKKASNTPSDIIKGFTLEPGNVTRNGRKFSQVFEFKSNGKKVKKSLQIPIKIRVTAKASAGGSISSEARKTPSKVIKASAIAK